MLKRLAILLLLGLFVFSGAVLGAEGELNVAAWRDYVSPDVVQSFEKEHNVNVNIIWYDTYGQMIELVKNDDIDVIITGDLGIPKLKSENLLASIEKSKITNFKYLDPLFKGLSFDPNNEYTLPYHYIYIGLIYHTDRVKRSEATLQNYFEAPAKFKGRLTTHPDKRYMIGMALKYMGVSMNNQEKDNFELVKVLLENLKGNLSEKGKNMNRNVVSPHLELLDGEADMAINYCAESTRRFLKAEKIGYVLPPEGAIISIDNLAISNRSENKDLAHDFINYYYNPEIAAMSVDIFGNPFPVLGVKELIKPEFSNNPAIYPPSNVIKRLEFAEHMPKEKLEIYDEIWNEVFGN